MTSLNRTVPFIQVDTVAMLISEDLKNHNQPAAQGTQTTVPGAQCVSVQPGTFRSESYRPQSYAEIRNEHIGLRDIECLR